MMHGSLPDRLRVLRAREGLPIIQAAEKIGIGRDTLSSLESGRRSPTFPTLLKIARGYGVDVEDLLEASSATADEKPGRDVLDLPESEFLVWLSEATLTELHTLMTRPPEKTASKKAIMFYGDRKTQAANEFFRRAPIKEVMIHDYFDPGEADPGEHVGSAEAS